MARRAGREEVYAVADRFVEEALSATVLSSRPERRSGLPKTSRTCTSGSWATPMNPRIASRTSSAVNWKAHRKETRQLAAELLYVYLLFPFKFGGDRKRRIIHGVLDGTSIAVPEDLEQALDHGIASFGPALQNRPWQLAMLLEFFREWKTMPLGRKPSPTRGGSRR